METGSLEWHGDPAKADLHRSLREDTKEERDEMMEMKQREEGKGKGEGVLAWRSGGVELRPEMLPAETRSHGRGSCSGAGVGWVDGTRPGRTEGAGDWSDGESREEGGGSCWLDREEILRWKRTGGGGWEDGTRLLISRVGSRVRLIYIADGFRLGDI